MASKHDQEETSKRHNPFWLDEVKKFGILKFELNQNNKDLYFWVVDKSSFADMVEDEVVIEEKELKEADMEQIIRNEILVRVVGVDYNDGGIMRKYIGGALFYEMKEKKWNPVARLNVLKYAQVKDKPHRRFRISKPTGKVDMFEEEIGEDAWDRASNDFKPGLIAYHDESHRDYKEYAGMLGATLLFAEIKIIQNEAIRYPVTHLNRLMDISFDLLNAKGDEKKLTVNYVPK